MSDQAGNASLDVRLLGAFSVSLDGSPIRLDGRRTRELLAFLLINRDRRLAREAVAETLWPSPCGEGRKKLRHVLWQLHTKLEHAVRAPVIISDGDSVGIEPGAPVHADIGRLEDAHRRLGAEAELPLRDETVRLFREVATTCDGELLEGCYQDWCLLERERYRAISLAVIDRLISHFETSGEFESGIAFGMQLLRHDPSSERTHRRLMLMRYRSGDRSGALRQFRLCERSLRTELDVAPSARTCALHEIVRLGEPLDAGDAAVAGENAALVTLLQELRDTIAAVERLVGNVLDHVHDPQRRFEDA